MQQLLLADLQEGLTLENLQHDLSATDIVLGAMASRDWRPMHHDAHFARERSGKQDIFMNSPNQAAWFERYINERLGPRARIRRLVFKMKRSIYPGAALCLQGEVAAVRAGDSGEGNVELKLMLRVGEDICSECTASVSVPLTLADNPWRD